MAIKRSTKIVGTLPWLDNVASVIHAVFDPIVGESSPKDLKDILVGTWLGHPLHPLIVQLPIGFWTSASVLDLLRQDEAADLMITAGLLTSTGAMVTGAAQWVDASNDETPRRLGALHGAVNSIGTGFYLASMLARRRGDRKTGVVLSLAGMTFVSLGGMLGGDLAYDLGIGVDHAAFDQPVETWKVAIAEDELKPGKPTRVDIDGTAVMLLQHDDGIHAIGAVCPHLGAPLDEGEIDGENVICPWHGSTFCLTNGSLVHGPATSPVPSYETRRRAGKIDIRVKTA